MFVRLLHQRLQEHVEVVLFLLHAERGRDGVILVVDHVHDVDGDGDFDDLPLFGGPALLQLRSLIAQHLEYRRVLLRYLPRTVLSSMLSL